MPYLCEKLGRIWDDFICKPVFNYKDVELKIKKTTPAETGIFGPVFLSEFQVNFPVVRRRICCLVVWRRIAVYKLPESSVSRFQEMGKSAFKPKGKLRAQ